MGRSSHCWSEGTDSIGRFCRGKVVNAYVRLGTPSKWSVIGRICTTCGDFHFAKSPT